MSVRAPLAAPPAPRPAPPNRQCILRARYPRSKDGTLDLRGAIAALRAEAERMERTEKLRPLVARAIDALEALVAGDAE